MFYKDYYDNNILIWKKNKAYDIVRIEPIQCVYFCATETDEIFGMDMSNKNMYATM